MEDKESLTLSTFHNTVDINKGICKGKPSIKSKVTPSPPRPEVASRKLPRTPRARPEARAGAAPTPLMDDPDDYMLIDSEIKGIERDCGKFDVDLCCDRKGLNSHCKKFYSIDNPAQHAKIAGKNVFCNGPYSANKEQEYADILENYLREKALKPFTTSGTFVVPDWKNKAWDKHLHGMKLIRYYPPGKVLFSRPMSDGTRRVMPPIRWPVCVYWDPPIPKIKHLHVASDDEDDGDIFEHPADETNEINPSNQGMTLRGMIHDKECNVFLDSGAEGRTANFIRKTFVDTLNVPIQKGKSNVRMGDGRTNQTYGTVNLRLQLRAIHGTLRQTMDFTVIDLPDEHEIILGVPFLHLFNPDVDWEKGIITTRKGRKIFTLKPMFNGYFGKRPDKDTTILQRATALEFERDLYSDDTEEVFLLHISKCKNDYSARVGKETSESKLPDDISPQIRKLVHKFKEIFPNTLPKGKPSHDFSHKIELIEGAQPHCRYPYRLSLPETDELRNQLSVLLEEGRVRTSHSPWGAPVLFARKKDGGLRMCVDYRALNKLTIKNKYPLPRTDDCLDKLANASLFTSLDLASGFWQIPVAEEDISKTAFVTPMGQFEWKVMPFGLCNAPSTFQSVMDRVLHEYIGKFVVVYMDDICIFSSSEEEHLYHLDLVFRKLKEYGLFCKPHKCKFGKKEAKFLGFIVGGGTQKLDPSIYDAITHWKPPADASAVRSFMGFLHHYRKFIKNLSDVATPLSKLQSPKAEWEWTDSQVDAFKELKRRVCTAPVLRLFDPSRPIRVHTDASGWATGAVLLQDFGQGWQPVAYDSKKLNSAQRNYSAYDRELLAIYRALLHWRCYLLGRRFEVLTDHATLRHMLEQPNLTNPRRIRWISELMEYDFEVKYAPGKDNPSDPLSRLLLLSFTDNGFEIKAMNVSTPEISPSILERIIKGYKKDPFYQSASNLEHLEKCNGLLYLRDRICLPDDQELREIILREYHEAPYTGHQGIKRTMDAITRVYYWPRMKVDVQLYIKMCLECQRNKVRNIRAKGLLQPLPIPARRWEDISMDYITHLPTCLESGNDSIWVVVDRFTKMCHFIPCHHTITAKETARLFVKEIFRLHGIPKTIVSDRDKNFTSLFWKGLFDYLGTRLAMSSGYHPQTDGQTERMNRTLEEMLRAYCAADHRQQLWDDYLPLVEFQYNNAVNISTGFTPFFMNYGQHPNTPATLLTDEAPSSLSLAKDSEEFVGMLKEILHAATASMERAQVNAKRYYDQKSNDPQFKVGDLVFVEGTGLPTERRGTKLSSLRHGPFKIVEQINPVAFRLDTGATWKVHNVFHVSFLTPHTSHRVPTPLQVLDGRLNRRKKQLLVRYENSSVHQDAWVDEREFKEAHPKLYLDFVSRMATSFMKRRLS